MSVDSDGPFAADKDFIGKEAALARKEHPKYRMVGLEFSRESTEDISIWERVYWYGVEVGRCAQTRLNTPQMRKRSLSRIINF